MILEPSSSKAALDSSSVTRVASVDSPPAYSQPSELSETASESLRSEFKNVQQKRRGRRKRVALIALAIVFYSIALVVFVVQKPWRRHWKSSAFFPPPLPYNVPLTPNINGTGAPDHVGFALMCSEWDFETPDTSRLQSIFPLNTTNIFIRNRAGGWVSGTLHTYVGKKKLPGYHIQVEVRPRFKKDAVDNNVQVCVLSGDSPGSYGVGIYDVWHPHKDDIDININVIVPPNHSLPSFSTNLPRFYQKIGEPGSRTLQLGAVELGGPVEQLSMNSGVARKLVIDAASSFSGSISVSEELHIKSLASSIDAHVTLMYHGHPFNVRFDTGHGPIDAAIRVENLGPTTETAVEKLPPAYCNISASTHHAPIRLEIAYASPRVVLQVDASTELAPLFMGVPPAFEGTFEIEARSSQADLLKSNAQDPLNDGRTRAVTFATPNATSFVSGAISWLDSAALRDLEHFIPSNSGNLQGRTLSAKALLRLRNTDRFYGDSVEWPTGCVVPQSPRPPMANTPPSSPP